MIFSKRNKLKPAMENKDYITLVCALSVTHSHIQIQSITNPDELYNVETCSAMQHSFSRPVNVTGLEKGQILMTLYNACKDEKAPWMDESASNEILKATEGRVLSVNHLQLDIDFNAPGVSSEALDAKTCQGKTQQLVTQLRLHGPEKRRSSCILQ